MKQVDEYIEKVTGKSCYLELLSHEQEELVCFLIGKLTSYEQEIEERDVTRKELRDMYLELKQTNDAIAVELSGSYEGGCEVPIEEAKSLKTKETYIN